MCDWANWLAYDVIGDLAFGKCFNCLDGTENRHLPRSLTDSAKFTNWVSENIAQPCVFVALQHL